MNGLTERNIIETIARVEGNRTASDRVNRTGRLVRAYVAGEWMDVAHASRSGLTTNWELTSLGGAVLVAPVGAVVFRFEPDMLEDPA